MSVEQSAKAYLQRVRLCDMHINNKIAELEKLKDMVTNITPVLRDDVVTSSGAKDKLGNTVSKIVDLQNEINRDVDEFIVQRNAVCITIAELQNPSFIAVLHKRYILQMTWDEIASDMNMSYRNVTRLHGRALQAVDKIIRQKENWP